MEARKVSLKVVSNNDLSDPPYPADTKSNGFRQEVDLSRAMTSRTWLLADPECRPWLWQLWLLSWGNVPVGTWEADDEMIAAAIGCKYEWFVGHRDQLMRGWQRHNDGRLYHPYITTQVLDMLHRRKGTAERMRRMRESASRVTASNAALRVSDASLPVTYAKEQEQERSVTNVTGAEAPDVKTMLWITGERLLGSRAYVGKLIKQHGEPPVFHALAECVSKNPADPRAYIAGLLKDKKGNGAAPRTREEWEAWGKAKGVQPKRGESLNGYVARLQAAYEAQP